MTPEATDAAAPQGTIHDLGYKRYLGTRRAPQTRWRVIARDQIAGAFKFWWRFKAALGLGAIITAIAGGMMLFASDRKSSLGRAQGLVMQLIDTALPESIIWYCRAGFVVSLTIGATVVASDVQSGAFTFYFARSVRPHHYVIGKLVGMCALLAMILVAGPLVIAGLRLGVSDNLEEVGDLLGILWKTLVIGGVATLAYAAVPLGFSALMPNRRHALALWAAYYLVFGAMVYELGKVSSSAIAALDLPRAVQTITYALFDLSFRSRDVDIPLEAAITSLAAHIVLAIALVAYQVRRAQRIGIGGAS